jgi:hypothetical protein
VLVKDPTVFFCCNHPSPNLDSTLSDIVFTEEIIIASIKELSSSSSPGPDGIPASLLINCATELAPVLMTIFTDSLKLGLIPSPLKRAAIVPVFKTGDKSIPKNYRPISLTSVIAKVLERIIRKQVFSFLSVRGALNDTQHGFRSGRSCLSALLDVFDNIMHILDTHNSVDMVYLDFSKAFDKVDHGVLLHKLRDAGITGNLGRWFYHFLTNRTHYVRLPGGTSTVGPVLSGVPQGTVLGPLLFLIMISDINRDTHASQIISFADDTRIYKGISEPTDCDDLQVDLNAVYDWAVANNMFFNAQKFNYLSFSPSVTSPPSSNIYINSNHNIINPVDNVLDLGIFMSSNCTFDFHIANLTKRCTNLSGWVLRTFKARDSTTMLTLFKSLVLSRLDNGSQLWSPHKIGLINQIEKVQRSFTKHIIGLYDLPYHERLKCLRLYSLQRRRERYCIIYVWKIIEGLVPNFTTPINCTHSNRRGRSCAVSHVNVGRHGTLAYNSFRWRSIRLFNKLPTQLRSLSTCSTDRFKSQLDIYLKTIPDLPSQPGINNSLDGGDHTQWRLPSNDLASN